MKEELLKLLKDIATQLNVEWQMLYALLKNENRDLQGLDKNGNVRKRFEEKVFTRYKNLYKQTKSELELKAMSTSWGLPQIMGYHYSIIGYTTAIEMSEKFKDEKEQLQGFKRFLEKNPAILGALRKKEFKEIAKMYNGPAYERNNYDGLLIKHYKEAKK